MDRPLHIYTVYIYIQTQYCCKKNYCVVKFYFTTQISEFPPQDNVKQGFMLGFLKFLWVFIFRV